MVEIESAVRTHNGRSAECFMILLSQKIADSLFLPWPREIVYESSAELAERRPLAAPDGGGRQVHGLVLLNPGIVIHFYLLSSESPRREPCRKHRRTVVAMNVSIPFVIDRVYDRVYDGVGIAGVYEWGSGHLQENHVVFINGSFHVSSD
jgi:hypothetical protein